MSKIIPKPSLEKWANKKFFEQHSTMELMISAENSCDLASIAIVALMEVDPATRYQGMGEKEAKYTQSCHDYLRTLGKNPEVARKKTFH